MRNGRRRALVPERDKFKSLKIDTNTKLLTVTIESPKPTLGHVDERDWSIWSVTSPEMAEVGSVGPFTKY